MNIVFSQTAQTHFQHLLEKESQTVPGMALRLFVDHPGLPTAEVGLSFCPPGEEKRSDLRLPLEAFKVYIDRLSEAYLEGAHIDYQNDALGGQLVIKAPHLKGHRAPESASLYERVQDVLTHEVNPNLAHHGGLVHLVQITPENVVVLQFGGGCHGCGMVDVTLKQGIERSLMTQFPEVTAVRDVTDHSTGDNPYYVEGVAP